MKHSFTFIALFAGLISPALAQPVLTYNSSHSIGTQSTMHLLTDNASVLQQTGANVTWDLSNSSVSLPVGYWDAVDPATTPYASTFPNANLSFKQTLTGSSTITYMYMIDNTDALLNIGSTDGSTTITWVQNDKLVQYPFTYGGSFTATRQQTGDAPDTYTRTYDSYGTLIINGKTFSNVIRVSKNNGNAVWFTTSPSIFPIIIQSNSTNYRYNEPGNMTTGVNEATGTIHAKIYPNPCHDMLMVDATGELQYEVVNMLGQVVATGTLNNNTIHTDHLQKGMYFLLLKDAALGKNTQIFLKE